LQRRSADWNAFEGGDRSGAYRHPKLGAIATTNINGMDFAALLERAIERSGTAKVITQIELACGKVRESPGGTRLADQ
jgi:hypothetical protein